MLITRLNTYRDLITKAELYVFAYEQKLITKKCLNKIFKIINQEVKKC